MNGDHNPDGARQRAVERLLQGRGVDGSASSPANRHGGPLADELEAYLRAEEAWETLAGLKADPDYADLLGRPTWREGLTSWRQSLKPRWKRRSFWAIGGAAVAAGLGTLAWLGVQPSGAVYNTHVAEIRQVSLEDGSTIALGAKSRLSVTYSDEQRDVVMQPGEAFFSVAPDPDRPFVIRAGDTRISVVGTKFNVKYDGQNVRVTVTEGTVKVAPPKPLLTFRPTPVVPVEAGKEALIEPEVERPAVKPMTSAPTETWLNGWLAYEDVSLKEIIADVNRYLPGEVVISSEQLAQQRLTASFRADQVGAFLESLPRVVPVRLEGEIGQRVVLTEASPG